MNIRWCWTPIVATVLSCRVQGNSPIRVQHPPQGGSLASDGGMVRRGDRGACPFRATKTSRWGEEASIPPGEGMQPYGTRVFGADRGRDRMRGGRDRPRRGLPAGLLARLRLPRGSMLGV